MLIAFLWPAQNKLLIELLAARGVTSLSVDCIPRITRAQKMDALSSMANIAGYRAVIEAANAFGRFFTGQVTAAGKVPPAKVLVIGAGVAGLAAIGAARGLGAIVRAFDTRPAAREQVQSLGAEFLEVHVDEDGSGEGGYAKEMSPAFVAAEMALFAAQAKDVDIIITTALIPGRPAPKLLSTALVESMRKGSVIVDLAAAQGGNCELTKPDEAIRHTGVTIVGFTDLVSRMAAQASQLYGTNLVHLLSDMGGGEKLRVDLDDEVVRAATVTHESAVTWPPPKPAPKPTVAVVAAAPQYPSAGDPHQGTALAAVAPRATTAHRPAVRARAASAGISSTWLAIAGLALVGVGIAAPPAFLTHLIVFVLACFVGYQVIWNVSPALHTPLMSVTNAISGIILLGGMLHVSGGTVHAATVLGAVAILIATVNVAGGFLVTQRMLRMFRR